MNKLSLLKIVTLILASSASMIALADTSSITTLQSAGEKMNQVSSETHIGANATCRGSNTRTTEQHRTGNYAYKHTLERCANRAEIRMIPTEIGKTYWQKWSIFIPTNYTENSSGAHILSQLSAYPKTSNTTLPCGGIGHILAIEKLANGSKELIYDIQASNNINGNGGGVCTKFNLGAINSFKGHWVDFIQYAKWTGNSDGFLKLWVKINGVDNDFVQKINHQGATWWNDEDVGPIFKMGLYKGGSSWGNGNTQAVIYTDAYRLMTTPSDFNDLDAIASLP